MMERVRKAERYMDGNFEGCQSPPGDPRKEEDEKKKKKKKKKFQVPVRRSS